MTDQRAAAEAKAGEWLACPRSVWLKDPNGTWVKDLADLLLSWAEEWWAKGAADLGELEGQVAALTAEVARLKTDHHALGRWPECPRCRQFFQNDENAAMEHSKMEAALQAAQEEIARRRVVARCCPDCCEHCYDTAIEVEQILQGVALYLGGLCPSCWSKAKAEPQKTEER